VPALFQTAFGDRLEQISPRNSRRPTGHLSTNYACGPNCLWVAREWQPAVLKDDWLATEALNSARRLVRCSLTLTCGRSLFIAPGPTGITAAEPCGGPDPAGEGSGVAAIAGNHVERRDGRRRLR
jgi:hypothetical protein